MKPVTPEDLIEEERKAFIRAGEQCGIDRIARRLAQKLHTANLRLQEVDGEKVAMAQVAFETGYWSGRHGLGLVDPLLDMETARDRFISTFLEKNDEPRKG